MKKTPVEVDVPELLIKAGMECIANELTKVVGDLASTTFYYLLRVGEYTKMCLQNSTKQTILVDYIRHQLAVVRVSGQHGRCTVIKKRHIVQK